MCSQRLYKCSDQSSNPLGEKDVSSQSLIEVPRKMDWESWFDGETASEDFMNVREQDV